MSRLLTSLTGRLTLAFVIALGTVGVACATVAVVMQRSLNLSEEAGTFAFQVGLVSIPFLILAFAGVAKKLPWLVGLGMTAAFWGIYLADAIYRDGGGSGANIGLGLLILLSPMIITLSCLATAKSQNAPIKSHLPPR